MSAIIGFFTTTKLGQALGLAILLTIAIFATWRVVDHKAFVRGEASVQAKWDKAVAEARQKATDHAAAQARASSGIAATARTDSQAAAAAIEKTTVETKEVIRYVYRDPPKGAPVRPGSCVYPLDGRVQDRIQLSVDQARAAAR